MKITPIRQRNAVSQGIALGLVMLGRDVLPYDKVRVDLSFTGAWRAWDFRDRFAQVSTALRNGSDGVHVMTCADEGKRVWHLYWERSGGELRILPRAQWEDDAVDPGAVAEALDGQVPAAGWRALAEDFLELFDR